jgi:glucose/arabinose dehydrogenase
MRPTLAAPQSAARRLRKAGRTAGLALAAACAAWASSARAQVYPAGFNDELVTTGLQVPTAFVLPPDGRMFVAEQGGAIRCVVGGIALPEPMIILPVTSYREQGLLGMALDPQFPVRPYVFVVYTRFTGFNTDNFNWVSRLTVDGDLIDPASEVVLFDEIPTGIGYHVGGCIRFGADGNLYISTGDTNWAPPWPQDLSRLEGKLLRLRPDGTVPPDNPFVGVPGARPEIFQYGLRNPFRFSIQPDTGRPFIGDVGASAWEEIDTGPPGANFGWPLHEGPETVADSTTVDPLFAYSHAPGSASVIGNLFYTGAQFPLEFVGNYFFFDHSRGTLARMVLNPDNTVASVDTMWIDTPFSGAGYGPVDLQQGPDGSLYYNTFFPGQIRRIFYTGSANRQPQAVASATPTNGYIPLDVQFSSAGTFDADLDSLSYDWSFGDGSAHATVANPQHTYMWNGVFSAQLVVHDGQGGVSTAQPIVVTVGNLGPIVTIAQPLDGQLFLDNETIVFSGTAVDPEVGPLPPERLHWNVFLHHLEHVHPAVLDYTGSSGSFAASFHNEEPEHIWYTITAWAEDDIGLRRETTVRIDPNPASPGGTTHVLLVDGPMRDAVSVAGEIRTGGYNSGKPFLYASNDDEQMAGAMQFPVDLPPGATILEANLIVRGGPIQAPSPTGALAIRAYDVADCPPFADGPGDLDTLYATTATAIPWPGPDPWPEADVQSPDVTALVQEFVSRPDYAPGHRLGILISRGTIELGASYAWADYVVPGAPSRLRLKYVVPTSANEPPRAPFTLQQNAPNPFNPSTRITFALEHAATARLEIVDVRGRLVRVLHDGPLHAGPHVRTWDGRSTRGREVASGVYVYRLTAGGVTAARRMVLVR